MSADDGVREATIELRGLCLEIDGRTLVDDLSLVVQPGERVGITGPSGCGKTTLLRALVKRKIDFGTAVRFEIRSRRTGYIAQTGGLAPWYTVQENVRLFSSMDFAKDETKRQEIIEKCQISRLDTSPVRLSGGEAQRARLACAAAVQPDLFCADEPLSEVGVEQRCELLSWWSGEIHRLRAALVLVSHDLDTLLYMCDRILVLRQCRDRKAQLRYEHQVNLPHPRHFEDLGLDSLTTIRRQIVLQLLGTSLGGGDQEKI
jgi:ABC-type nitrate/sulfonate/bicarbonate transport system ATPase subunit